MPKWVEELNRQVKTGSVYYNYVGEPKMISNGSWECVANQNIMNGSYLFGVNLTGMKISYWEKYAKLNVSSHVYFSVSNETLGQIMVNVLNVKGNVSQNAEYANLSLNLTTWIFYKRLPLNVQSQLTRLVMFLPMWLKYIIQTNNGENGTFRALGLYVNLTSVSTSISDNVISINIGLRIQAYLPQLEKALSHNHHVGLPHQKGILQLFLLSRGGRGGTPTPTPTPGPRGGNRSQNASHIMNLIIRHFVLMRMGALRILATPAYLRNLEEDSYFNLTIQGTYMKGNFSRTMNVPYRAEINA